MEVVHAARHTVVVGADPHGGVGVHLAVSGVEQVVVIADLGKALCSDKVGKVVGFTVDICEAVSYDVAVFVAPILAGLQSAAILGRVFVNVARPVLVHLAQGRSEDDAIFQQNGAVDDLACFVAVVGLTLVFQEAAASTLEQSGFLVKVVPNAFGMVVLLVGIVSVNHKSVPVDPVGAFLQFDPLTAQIMLAKVILGTAVLLNKGATNKNPLVIKGKLFPVNGDHAGHRRAGGRIEIVQVCALQRRSPAGVQRAGNGVVIAAAARHDSAGKISAVDAGYRLCCRIAGIMMLAVLACGIGLAVGVDHIAVYICGLDGDGLSICLHRHVHCAVAVAGIGEIVIRVDRHGVALFSGGAADEVHNAVFLVYRTVNHRHGTGVGMVMSGEHEVNTGSLSGSRQVLVDKFVHCVRIGAVSGNVHGQHFPAAVRLFGIFSQPPERLAIAAGRCIVDYCHIDVAVLIGVVTAASAGRQIVDRLCDLTVIIAVELVVAQHVDHIHAVHGSGVKHRRQRRPVSVFRTVVHSIAGLDRKVVGDTGPTDHTQDRLNIGCIGGLGVTDDEKVGAGLVRIQGETEHIAPGLPIAHAVVVSAAGGQALQFHGAQTHRLAGEVHKFCGACVFHELCRFIQAGILCIQPQDRLVLGIGNAGHPGNILSAAVIGRGVVLHEERRCGSFPCYGMNRNILVPGALHCPGIIDIGCVNCDLTSCILGHGDLTVGIGHSFTSRVIDIHRGPSHGTPHLICHGHIEGMSNHRRRGADLVVGLDCNCARSSTEGIGEVTLGTGRKAAGGNAVSKAAVLDQIRRDLEGQHCQLFRHRTFGQSSSQYKLAGSAIVAAGTGNAFGEGDHRCAHIRAEIQRHVKHRNIGAVFSRQGHGIFATQIGACRGVRRCKGNGSIRVLCTCHGEVTNLVGLVAVVVTNTDPNGVQPVCQFDIGQDHQIVLGHNEALRTAHVHTVNVNTCRVQVHTCGVFTAVIGKLRSKGDLIAFKYSRAVLCNRDAVCIVVDIGDRGVGRVLIVVAVDKLNVIDVDRARRIAIRIGGEPFRDQPDGVVAQHFECTVALAHQAGRDIDPALACHIRKRGGRNRLPCLIGIGVAISQVDGLARRLNNALHAVGWRPLRNVHPHADAGRRTGRIVRILHVAVAQDRRSACGGGKVVAQFKRLVTEADRLAAVNVHDLCMSLRIAVTSQAKVGRHLFLDGGAVGICNHQGVVVVFRVKVLGLVYEIAVFVGFHLPGSRLFAGGLIHHSYLFPDLHSLITVFIVPEHCGQLAHGNGGAGGKDLSVGPGIAGCGQDITAERSVGCKFRSPLPDPADGCRIGHGCIVGAQELQLPCEVRRLVDDGLALTLHEHLQIDGGVQGHGTGGLEEGQVVRFHDGHRSAAHHLVVVKELSCDNTHGSVGSKHTVFRNGSHAGVFQRPADPLRGKRCSCA